MNRRILLIDSSAPLHRYHHSPTPPVMSTYRGQSINVTAVHRYLNYIVKLSRQFDFDQMIHVLDPEGGSAYRKHIYPEYKAGRPPTPPEFALQKKLLPKILTAFGQHHVCMPGVESDDVLATLATLHAERGDLVVIVTPDKDLLQLVEDGRIVVAVPQKDDRGNDTHKFMDEAAVMAKMGVRPDQVADLLAIMNDNVDNIKGVFKAGPTTAAKWLNEFGDLQTLMTNAAGVKGKIGDSLREALPRLDLNQRLTRVLRNIHGIECIDAPPPAFNKAMNEQARMIVAAKAWWPDSLREMQGPHSPEMLTPPGAVTTRVTDTAIQTPDGTIHSHVEETVVTFPAPGTADGDDFPFADAPPAPNYSRSPMPDGDDMPDEPAEDPEDPFADEAPVSRSRFSSYSF